MARLRYNGLVAELAGSGLTNVATAITFAAALTHSGGTNVPTITGTDYIPLTLLDSDGVPAEIVYLTAYTSGATTGTITRAREGTTGVVHAAGATIVHSPTVRDVGFVGCKAVRTATQAATQNVDTAVQFTGTEEFDSDTMHDTSTNSSRITVPYAGIYEVHGHLYWAANASGTRYVILAKNGSNMTFGTTGVRASPPGANVFMQDFSDVLPLAAGDYLELIGNQDGAASLNINYAHLSVILKTLT
jgi:hypothetical protein